MKKNCYNCCHLTEEYEMVDSEGYSVAGGYHCEKQYQKMYELGKETQYEKNIDREAYRQKAKVCFEPKIKRQENGDESKTE